MLDIVNQHKNAFIYSILSTKVRPRIWSDFWHLLDIKFFQIRYL